MKMRASELNSVAVRILVPETSSHRLLALLTGWARRPEPAADDSRPDEGAN